MPPCTSLVSNHYKDKNKSSTLASATKMSNQLSALPVGSTILITGVNGYIGSHIANMLLALGFRVRGTVRAPKPWLNDMFTAKYGEGVFETVLLDRFDDIPTLEKIMDGTSAVLHAVCTIRSSIRHLEEKEPVF